MLGTVGRLPGDFFLPLKSAGRLSQVIRKSTRKCYTDGNNNTGQCLIIVTLLKLANSQVMHAVNKMIGHLRLPCTCVVRAELRLPGNAGPKLIGSLCVCCKRAQSHGSSCQFIALELSGKGRSRTHRMPRHEAAPSRSRSGSGQRRTGGRATQSFYRTCPPIDSQRGVCSRSSYCAEAQNEFLHGGQRTGADPGKDSLASWGC